MKTKIEKNDIRYSYSKCRNNNYYIVLNPSAKMVFGHATNSKLHDPLELLEITMILIK
jgi:hypothetical protein